MTMNPQRAHTRPGLSGFAAAAAIVLSTFAGAGFADDVKITLSGDQEVPPVTTAAKGSGTITVNNDMTVSGSVMTSGIDASMAHIHHGAAGKNGPVLITLTKSGDNWMVPAGAKLTDDQYKAYKAGELYVNVHSPAHKGGEIRGQLK